MEKKAFRSQLFRRKIEVNESDDWSIVWAETLFRIDDLEFRRKVQRISHTLKVCFSASTK